MPKDRTRSSPGAASGSPASNTAAAHLVIEVSSCYMGHSRCAALLCSLLEPQVIEVLSCYKGHSRCTALLCSLLEPQSAAKQQDQGSVTSAPFINEPSRPFINEPSQHSLGCYIILVETC
jgi:hypothetical protein